MERELDLTTASREVLLAIIAKLQQRIETLEGKAKPGGPRGMPGLKPKADRKPAQPRGPKRPRRHGFSPAHDSHPSGGACPGLLPGVRRRIGGRLGAADPGGHRHSGGQSERQQRGFAPDFRTFRSVLVGVIHRVARQAQGELGSIRERIRGSPVVHADETGWRENGVNGYVWTFSTPTERYFLRRGRNKEVVDEALGEDFAGALVSDFYAAYQSTLIAGSR